LLRDRERESEREGPTEWTTQLCIHEKRGLPHLQFPATPCDGDEVSIQQVIWLHAMPLHGGVDLPGCVKVDVVVRHAGVDGSSVQLQDITQE
jgi:hypothetical protein